MFLLVPMKNQARAAKGRRKMKPAGGAPKTAPSFLRLFRVFSPKMAVFRCAMGEVNEG